ncbi:MAG: hypothetical protein WCA77_05155, partial [Thermoplasmata archaeon]
MGGVVGIFAAVLLLGIVPFPASGASAVIGVRSGSLGSANATLTEATTGEPLGSGFWGTTISAEAPITENTTAYVSSVSTHWVVWPGGALGDTFDYLNSSIHEDQGMSDAALTNAPAFVRWCESARCEAIVQVPGEIDSPATAAAEVGYLEQDLGFHPAFWEIGNEPARWTHFGIPWAKWGDWQTQEPTALQYAQLVRAYVAAMRTVDPHAQIIGFPGFGKGEYGEAQWISDVVSINGPNLSAVAIHVYPDGDGPAVGPNLGHFLSTIEVDNKGSLLYRVPLDQQAIASACPTCHIALFVTELGSEVRYGTDTPLVEGFPDTLYIAGEVIEAIDLKIPNVDYYALSDPTAGSWFNLTGPARPAFQLYAELFSRLGPTAYPVSIDATNGSSSVTNLYGVATTGGAGNSTAFLVDNANLTTGVAIQPASIAGLTGGPAEEWAWNSSTQEPVTTFWPQGLPESIDVPALSLALIEASPAHAEPVVVDASGLAPGTRWYATLGTTLETTASAALTFFAVPGELPLDLEGPVVEYSPTVRLVSSGNTTVTVGANPISVNVSFTEQAWVNVSAAPQDGGGVYPLSKWWNVSTNVSINAGAETGFTFGHWSGSGLGSYSGTRNPADLVVDGPITEVAVFGGGFNVTFVERGLATGTAWTVDVEGQSLTSYDAMMSFQRVNGTYSFSVDSLEGFSPTPSEGTFVIAGSTLEVGISWGENGASSGPTQVGVTFEQVGLPFGQLWWVLMDKATTTATGSRLVANAVNGTNLYSIGASDGYQAEPSTGSVRIEGAPVEVSISFGLTKHAVTFEESGLGTGVSWSVTLGSSEANATSPSVEFLVPEGTYPFHVIAPLDYGSNVTTGTITVGNAARVVSVAFSEKVLGTGSSIQLNAPR